MRSNGRRVLAEGLLAGFAGYLAVVVFFVVYNLARNQSAFHTAALLGTALFWRGSSVTALVPATAPVIAYNGVHLLTWLAIGMAASWLVQETEAHRPLWYLVFFIFLAGFIVSVAVVGIFAAEIAGILPWWTVVVTNLVAGIAAGSVLWRSHPGLTTGLDDEP